MLDPQAKIAEGFSAGVSPMPPFGLPPPARDIEDLLANLQRLKKDPPPGTVLKRAQDLTFE